MLTNGETAILSSETDGSKQSEDVCLVFYPAYCYSASPTWFTWVKLTAYDVHKHLQSRRDFATAQTSNGTNDGLSTNQTLLLFYLNHPIQFVQLVGVVVSIDLYFEKFWLFTIDDSSGATIDIRCQKPEKKSSEQNTGKSEETVQDEYDNDHKARCDAMLTLDVGAVVQVKGRISTFRAVRQLQLDRISVIHETNQEIRLIAARTDFCKHVLSRPWDVAQTEQKRLHMEALGEDEEQNKRARKQQKSLLKKIEKEKRHARKIMHVHKQDEQRRRLAAHEALNAAELLKQDR